VTDDLKEKAIALSDAGQLAFERGNYRAAVTAFEQAVKLANPNTRLGGDISLWLVNAYAAANLPDKAIALCEVLTRHPHWDTRKQSKRLLYILKAPKLKLKAEWQTRIPDLSELENDGDRPLNLSRYPKLPQAQTQRQPAEPKPEDLSRMNTQDNGFLWVALVAIALTVGSLIWLG
jgi:tetratricopeptide (TPR) repeat protein